MFSRREQLTPKSWSTSGWVIDEKAYALAHDKKLVLLKEEGVDNIGGLQGDYEYIEFSMSDVAEPLLKVLETFTDDES